MSAFVSRLQRLSPKKGRDHGDHADKGMEEAYKDSNSHTKQSHKPLGRLSNVFSNTLPSSLRKDSAKSTSSNHSHRSSDLMHAYTDGEESSTEVKSSRRFSDRSGKPPVKKKPQRTARLHSADRLHSTDGALSDSGSVLSLPSVRSLSERYMPGRRFSETSTDSDVFETPSPTFKRSAHYGSEAGMSRSLPRQNSEFTDQRRSNSVKSYTAGLDWRSKPTEYWTTEDVVEWSTGLGIDKLPQIFRNAGITGTHLSEITDEILVELGLKSMVDRRKFLAEVKGVTNRKMSSLWSIKQVSMKRRNLERSTDQLYANLENLQKLNEEQEKKISSSLYEIQQEQLEAKELLSRETILGSSDSFEDDAFLEKSKLLCDWSTEDVVQWLENNNLSHFITVFRENGIAGRDLEDDNLAFLDHLYGFDTEAREALLSAIYRLQNPEPVSSQENDLEKIQTDEDRQKYIAALQVAALEQSFTGSLMSGSTGTLNSSLTGSTSTLFVGNLAGSLGQLDGSTDTLASPHLDTNQQNKQSDQSKHAIQRTSPRRTNVYRKNHCVSDEGSLPRPKSAPVSRESSSRWQESQKPTSLFAMLDTDKPVTVLCVKVSVLSDQLGFKVKVTERGKVVVTQTSKNAIPLRKADRILEACGKSLGFVECEEDFTAAVKGQIILDLVIVRAEQDKPNKASLSGPNTDDIIVLKNKLTQSENQWAELRHVLEELRDMDVGSEEYLKLFPITKVEAAKDTFKLEEQLQQLQTTLTNQVTRANSLERELDTKEQALKQAEDEKDKAVTKLHQLISIIDTENKGVDYDKIDNSVPLWENLRSANKEDVLQALKDTILESTRQKAYLDHLLGVVIDQAPYLLEELEDVEVPEEGSQMMVTRNIPEEWC